MKNIGFLILFAAFYSGSAFAVCDAEPSIESTGKILTQLTVKKRSVDSAADKPTENELELSVKAGVMGASWQTKGAEAAVITIFVNGKYNQDAILFAGEKAFEYRMLLGKYSSGEHRITIVLNKARSAPNALNVKIHAAGYRVLEDLKVSSKSADRSIPGYLAAVNAPLIYIRPDTVDKFSDIPVLTFYEIFDEPESIKKIRYTTIFTNEDGGTRSTALLARWGRMTDIEWVYEIRIRSNGEILSEIYQGANHEIKTFAGKRFGSHPLIFDTTVNNNFADAGCSALRLSPRLVQANLSDGSRETVMDAFSWTYRIMAQEAIRENRINPRQLGVNTIDDLRNYLYVEIYSENDSAAVAVEARTSADPASRSDFGDERLRVDRSGYKRIAVRLPSANSRLESLSLICYETSSNRRLTSLCRNARIVKFIRLDEKYQPVVTQNPEPASGSLKPNEKLIWALAD